MNHPLLVLSCNGPYNALPIHLPTWLPFQEVPSHTKGVTYVPHPWTPKLFFCPFVFSVKKPNLLWCELVLKQGFTQTQTAWLPKNDLDFLILLTLPHKCWPYRYEPSSLATTKHFCTAQQTTQRSVLATLIVQLPINLSSEGFSNF